MAGIFLPLVVLAQDYRRAASTAFPQHGGSLCHYRTTNRTDPPTS